MPALLPIVNRIGVGGPASKNLCLGAVEGEWQGGGLRMNNRKCRIEGDELWSLIFLECYNINKGERFDFI